MENNNITMTIVKRKPIIRKSLRLFDFHFYDEVVTNYQDSSEHDNEPNPYSKKVRDEYQFMIQMFGINERGETFCLYINDYTPFFYIKIGDKWTQTQVNELLAEIQKKLHGLEFVETEIVENHKLYGFSGGKKFKFLKLVFKCTQDMNRVKNLWYFYDKDTGNRKRLPFVYFNTSLELYETSIPPLLRYFHIHSISPSGWVSFKQNRVIKPETQTTTCKYEYICSLKDLVPMPEKETRVPYKICSFDIEASSSHGDFPLPMKTYKRFVTQLVDVFDKHHKNGTTPPDKYPRLIEDITLSAFRIDNKRFEDIDIVYPKSKPSKEKVLLFINTILKHPIETAIQTHIKDQTKQVKIDTLFSKLGETKQDVSSSDDIVEDDNDCVGGEGDSDGDDDDEDGGATRHYEYKKYTKKLKIQKNTTMIDILTDIKYSRDEKIQFIDSLFTLFSSSSSVQPLLPCLEGDKVTFIGSTFLRYGETEPYLNHCVVLGTCDDVQGAEIETADTETQLLLKWRDLIQRENPDIVIGYNIFGFDYEFLFKRSIENNCHRDFLLLSRKCNEIAAKPLRDLPNEYVLETTKMKIASGEYDMKYFKMTGRLQIDMLAYFRRDFNLSSYKLDDVAGQFIGDDIKKIVTTNDDIFGEITELYSMNLMGLHANDFIHIEVIGFTTDYYKNGQKFRVLAIEKCKEVDGKTYNVIMIQGHEMIDIKKAGIRWCTAKDDVSPQDIFRLSNGSSADRAVVAKYCIQDCNLVHHLMNKIDVLTGYIEMARICSVPINFLIFRGQGIKLTSFVAKKCREKNTLMPDIEKPEEADGYEGAIVLPPKCSMYMDNPVACVDYSSLYPSSMISQNYSHDSKVWTKEYDLEGKLVSITGERNKAGEFIYDNLPGYEYIDIEFDTYKYIRKTKTSREEKTKVGKKICRWAQLPENHKSIMPSILEELLKARSATKKLMKTEKDPFMQNILDKRQLGYKVTANSLYGQCGSRTSTFYEKDVAASTTATGRMMIIYARRIVEEVYHGLVYKTENYGDVMTKAEYIYGDTDSVFFTFNLEDPITGEKITGKKALDITIEIAQDAAKLCTQWLKPPMELSYEKTLMPFILLSKKRYVGILYETDPNKGKMKYMGLSLKRRDSCDYLKDVYGGLLNILMKENNIKNALTFLESSLNDLAKGRVPIDKLTITKALRSDYKNPNSIGHKVLADRIGVRDPGNKPKSGERIKFVFVVNDSPKALMGDKIETPEYILKNGIKIDYTHYITNQLMKPLQQLLGLALEQIYRIEKPNLIEQYRKDMLKLENEYKHDVELYMKKREKVCSTKIKSLLFDKTLNDIYNDKNKIQSIKKFYSRL